MWRYNRDITSYNGNSEINLVLNNHSLLRLICHFRDNGTLVPFSTQHLLYCIKNKFWKIEKVASSLACKLTVTSSCNKSYCTLLERNDSKLKLFFHFRLEHFERAFLRTKHPVDRRTAVTKTDTNIFLSRWTWNQWSGCTIFTLMSS